MVSQSVLSNMVFLGYFQKIGEYRPTGTMLIHVNGLYKMLITLVVWCLTEGV